MTDNHHRLIEDQQANAAEQEKAIRGMDDQIKLLRSEKADILEQIEEHKREIERLRQLLEQKKAEIAELDGQISEYDSKIDKLYEEMEKIEEEIAAKDELLKELQRKLNAILNKKKVERPKNIKYKGLQGDEIDMALAEYINTYGSPVPWKRISVQNYMYGTKKVNVKFIRNNLIIKVGGGSMMIQEFVATYEDIEIAKMNYVNADSGVVIQTAGQPGLSKQ